MPENVKSETPRGTMQLVMQVLGTAMLCLITGQLALAAPATRELRWEELIPVGPDGTTEVTTLRGVVQHGQVPAPNLGPPIAQGPTAPAIPEGEIGLNPNQPAGSGVVQELSGQRVRMRGFVVPVGFEGSKVKEFLLVPYAGACIHVPPPPPNQIVLIEAAIPFEMNFGLFAVVTVTGTLRTVNITTELASVGYRLEADEIGNLRYR